MSFDRKQIYVINQLVCGSNPVHTYVLVFSLKSLKSKIFRQIFIAIE